MKLVPTPEGSFGLQPIWVEPGDAIAVGRSSRCQLRLPVDARLVSRVHASLFARDGTWYVLDESRYGTFVDGWRVPHKKPIPLPDGVGLRFGDCSFLVQLDGGVTRDAFDADSAYRVSVQTVDLAASVNVARILQSALELPERLGCASNEPSMYNAACEYLVNTLAPALVAAYVVVCDADGNLDVLGRADRGGADAERPDLLKPTVSRRILQRLRSAPQSVVFLQRRLDGMSLDATVSASTRILGASWLEADAMGRPTVLYAIGDHVLAEGEELVAQYLSLVGTLVRQHLRTLRNAHLANYFSPKIVQLLMKKGGRALIEGEARLASCTSLFFDVRGSSLAVASSATDLTCVHEELRAVIGDVTDAVFDADGTIIDYAGDGVFAVWGVPFPQSDQALLATRCAMSIHQRLRRRSFRALGASGVLCGMGIAKGDVLVGAVGSASVAKYGVLGPSVHVAQRLAMLRGPGFGESPICVTSVVAEELGGSGIQLRALGPMQLPGLDGEMQVFQAGVAGRRTGTWKGLRIEEPPKLRERG